MFCFGSCSQPTVLGNFCYVGQDFSQNYARTLVWRGFFSVAMPADSRREKIFDFVRESR